MRYRPPLRGQDSPVVTPAGFAVCEIGAEVDFLFVEAKFLSDIIPVIFDCAARHVQQLGYFFVCFALSY